MRSRVRAAAWLPVMLCAAMGAAMTTGDAAAAPTAPAMPAAPSLAAVPTHEAIQTAVRRLRDDPNLGKTYTTRILKWVDGKTAPPPAAPAWLTGLFEFLAQVTSVLVWGAGALALAIAAVWIFRRRNLLRRTPARVPPPRPTQIGELDIAPSSLPDDVGAAALALLETGRSRDALSLLYRGALSRAVHRHGVRIHASFTEGQALQAVGAHLDHARASYFQELVALWQATVYAGRTAAADTIAELCRRFASTLDRNAA